jgi:hypothetical protein
MVRRPERDQFGLAGRSDERYALDCGGSADQCPRNCVISHAALALIECICKIVVETGGAPGRRLDA